MWKRTISLPCWMKVECSNDELEPLAVKSFKQSMKIQSVFFLLLIENERGKRYVAVETVLSLLGFPYTDWAV